MATKSPADIKAALSKRIEVLKELHANPLQQHPLYPLADDLKLMRGKLSLSYEKILEELKQLGLETSISDIKSFFKLLPVTKPIKKRASSKQTDASST